MELGVKIKINSKVALTTKYCNARHIKANDLWFLGQSALMLAARERAEIERPTSI